LISALACIGFFLTARKRDPSPYGFLAYYAVFLAIIYSLIPYKTPWLALNFWLPIALFSGLAIKSLWGMPANYPALRILMRGLLHPVGSCGRNLDRSRYAAARLCPSSR
jgi:predicted membrane-bound mannosyltransferase